MIGKRDKGELCRGAGKGGSDDFWVKAIKKKEEDIKRNRCPGLILSQPACSFSAYCSAGK